MKFSLYKVLFKRTFDVIVSSLLLILLSPVFVFYILFLTVANGGNPFFIQKRPGKNEKIFQIIKFKTMNDKKDKDGNLLPDAERLTRIGSFVRKSSIDELPQLINVVKGDMSFIGPRPLLTEYLPLYNEHQKKRHNVCPGITGWAQVNGRNAINWREKFELDVWYVDNLSFELDCQILFKTIVKVIGAKDISSDTSVTMEKFNGNN